MSYVGSTGASSVANPPVLVARAGLAPTNNVNSTSVAEGMGLWMYNSSNLTTDITAANFFTDAKRLGMRNGDVMLATTFSTQSSTGHVLVTGIITGVSTSGANLSTGGSITSTFA